MELTTMLKTVAPWLTAAATSGVPGLVAMAAGEIGKAVGTSVKPTVDAINAAVMGATPDQLLAMKASDQDFALKMQQLGYENVEALEKIAADDRANARKMQTDTRSKMPAVVTIYILTALTVVYVLLICGLEPRIAPELVGGILRTLENLSVMSVGFWMGTTFMSGRKTELMSNQSKEESKS